MRSLKINSFPLFVALVTGFCINFFSIQNITAQNWEFHDVVDVKFVKQYVTIPAHKDVMIVDSRPTKSMYDKGHIPTAINIPDSQFEKLVHLLPKDKNTLLIFYCQGPTCKMSHNSAWKAEKLGYKNVKNFSGGYPAWLKMRGNYGSVTAEYIKNELSKASKLFIVDSRRRRSGYNKGHIPTAISIPSNKFGKLNGLLPSDKEIPLIFYCSGFNSKMSHRSASLAIRIGYENVKVFAGGYPAWVKLVGKSETAEIDASEEEGGGIDLVLFKKILAENPASIMLIDVRSHSEFARGHLPTAINITNDELETKLNTMKADKPLVFVCATGARSGEAFYMVQDLRPDIKEVYYVEANITYKKDGSYKIE